MLEKHEEILFAFEMMEWQGLFLLNKNHSVDVPFAEKENIFIAVGYLKYDARKMGSGKRILIIFLVFPFLYFLEGFRLVSSLFNFETMSGSLLNFPTRIFNSILMPSINWLENKYQAPPPLEMPHFNGKK